MLAVSVLGPVELLRDGAQVRVRPGKTAEVLIRLALEARDLVRTERLIEDLWGDAAPTTARNTLQAKISSLRRSLGGAAVVSGTSAGYTLEIDRTAVDALEVPRLADAAHTLLERGDPAAALATATTALGMYRGDVLCDAGDGEWVTPHRVRLEDTRLRLLEDVFAARLRLGGAGELTADLEALVAAHPLREGLWALLITALYRDGRQADALAAYTQIRAVLAEELGLDPGPALQQLERQVLIQDPALDAAPRAAPGNLPPLDASLIGRDRELTDLDASIGKNRLVTIVGPAGVGKTRLAIELARCVDRYAGAWLVRLDDADAATVTTTLAAALGLRAGDEATLLAHLRGSDALIVLDNCEHVLDAVAALVPTVLSVAPALSVVATSQVPLALSGESLFSLAPLTLDASTVLFGERAREHRASVTLGPDDEAAVIELCRALDGLPLAIELAAARAKTLSIDDIARRLEDRFSLLRDPTSRKPARQRALRTAIQWSYDLLFPDDQRGMWALATFVGGAPLAAVEHVLAALDVPAASALDVVDRLVDRSLVVVDPVDGAFRYRLLDSTHAFGLEQLNDAGLIDVARAAHAAWYRAAADAAAAEVRGPEQARHLQFVRVERANIDAALAWSTPHDAAAALAIAMGFGWAWVVVGDGALGSERLRAALAAATEANASDRARAWSTVAWLEAGNRVDHALEAAMNAIAAAEDDVERAVAQTAHAFVLIQAGRAQEAVAILDECRMVFRAAERRWDEGACCILTAHAALFVGDIARAAAACEDAERLVRPLGDDWGIDHLDATSGQVARAQGRYADAAVALEGAAEAACRLGFTTSEGYHRVNLGRVQQLAGEFEAAAETLARAIEIGRSTAELRVVALAQVQLARVRRQLDDDAGARALLLISDRWYRENGGGERARLAALLLAAVEDDRGGLEHILLAARADGDAEIELLALDALARIASDASEADALLAAADALAPAIANVVAETDRTDAIRARGD